MCEIVEEYAKEVADEYAKKLAEEYAKEKLNTVKKLFENGCSLDMVLACVDNVPQEDIRNLYEEVMSTKSI